MVTELTLAREPRRICWRPMVALLVISPVIGELLSSSAPPALFFRPPVFIVFVFLYGGGALLIRELTLRRGQGWPAILLLGAAYGMIEEAFGAKSLFDPHWPALGTLGAHGRWLGVNWIWSLDLLLFHAVFSIALPILLVYLLFPQYQSKPWARPGILWVVGILYLLDVLLLFQKSNPYRPPVTYFLCAAVLTALFIAAAVKFPRDLFRPQTVRVPRAGNFTIMGLLASATFIFLMYVFPTFGFSPILTLVLVVVLVMSCVRLLLAWSGQGAAWQENHQFGLLAGALGFFMLLAPLQEINPTRSDHPTGMALVGVAGLVFLLWLGLRITRRHPIQHGLAKPLENYALEK
jgi:hypothetical protein